MKKYLLMPGYIRSAHDRDWHYIGAGRLAELYGVPMSECVVHKRGLSLRLYPGLIHLSPSLIGRYELPKAKETK
jgi:hypothetical protein